MWKQPTIGTPKGNQETIPFLRRTFQVTTKLLQIEIKTMISIINIHNASNKEASRGYLNCNTILIYNVNESTIVRPSYCLGQQYSRHNDTRPLLPIYKNLAWMVLEIKKISTNIPSDIKKLGSHHCRYPSGIKKTILVMAHNLSLSTLNSPGSSP